MDTETAVLFAMRVVAMCYLLLALAWFIKPVPRDPIPPPAAIL